MKIKNCIIIKIIIYTDFFKLQYNKVVSCKIVLLRKYLNHGQKQLIYKIIL